MGRRGRDFEEAVSSFYRELDPNAQVLFDHRVPDRDTGKMRQVDVWVVCQALGNITLRVLISCKDHDRALDIGEVEQFASEIQSTGATNGVLYGRSGFTKGALEKARKRNISCCRLFDNQPPELPSEQLIDTYVAVPVHRVLAEVPDERPEGLRWSEVLREPQDVTGNRRCSTSQCVSFLCFLMVQPSETETPAAPGPQDRIETCDIAGTELHPPFQLHFALTWRWFRAGMDVLRLTGSFNSTEGSFVGKATVGPVPLSCALVADRCEACEPPGAPDERGRIVFSALAAPTAAHVHQAMGGAVFGPGEWIFEVPDNAHLLPQWQARNAQDSAEACGVQVTVDIQHKRAET